MLDNSSKLIISILHDSLIRRPASKCLGKIDIELGHLLDLQRLQPNEGKLYLAVGWSSQCRKLDNLDVVLSLVNRKGSPSPAKLSVRITQDSTFAIAGDALEQTQAFAQKLSQPLVSNVSDTLTNISNTLSDQQKLITSFNALMKKFEPLIKIADEVSKVRCSISAPSFDYLNRSFPQKIHPYVNFAWQVLSAGMKVS